MRMLNVGCGITFHNDWVNVDIYSNSEHVLEMDLRKGLQFEDESFDVVYSSHVLEHLQRTEAQQFIAEITRVLKPGGILRLVVPDLEQIAKNYITALDSVRKTPNLMTEANYNWGMLELYDQVVRNKPGGEMYPYLTKGSIINSEFVVSRFGWEAERIIGPRKQMLEQVKRQVEKNIYIFGSGTFGIQIYSYLKDNNVECAGFIDNASERWESEVAGLPIFSPDIISKDDFVIIASTWWEEISEQLISNKNLIEHTNFVVFDKKIEVRKVEAQMNSYEMKVAKVLNVITEELGEEVAEVFKEGLFRNSGEVHHWMYDSFSLTRLMESNGIVNAQRYSAFESEIPQFMKYGLDSLNGKIRKPDSLFVEGTKKV